MSDEEAENHILARFEMEQKLLDLKREYYDKFRAVLSARKIAFFQKADNEFKRELVKKVRERRGQFNNRSGGN